jgi:hypothetical protein
VHARSPHPLRALVLAALLAPAAALASGAGAVADPGPEPEPGTPAPVEPAPAAPGPWTPPPFEAEYEVRYDGVPFSATGVRRLVPAGDGTLRFEATIDTWFLDLDESARFRQAEDGRLVPLAYDYRQRGIGRDRRRILDFDHAAGTIHRSGDRERTRPLAEGAYDPLSWQVALRRDLASGRARTGDVLHYPVTDGGEPKIYRMAVRGPEPATLATGTEAAVLVERLMEPGDERATRVWLSPERDWLLVRLEHTDENGRTLRLALRSADQAPALATVAP